MGLLHILPRLGKSGGHIPHSSLPFSYSLRLSFFFLLSLSLPPFVVFFFFISVLKPRFFCWRWGENAWDPRKGELFGRSGLSGRPGRTDKTLLGAAAGVSG